MGDSMMDFLFASQDASTASLTWAIHFMSERPELLARLRAEQAAVRPNDEPLTYELLEQMTFGRCFIKVGVREAWWQWRRRRLAAAGRPPCYPLLLIDAALSPPCLRHTLVLFPQEILRHCAPAPMVPNIALADVQLTDKVRVPPFAREVATAGRKEVVPMPRL